MCETSEEENAMMRETERWVVRERVRQTGKQKSGVSVKRVGHICSAKAKVVSDTSFYKDPSLVFFENKMVRLQNLKTSKRSVKQNRK